MGFQIAHIARHIGGGCLQRVGGARKAIFSHHFHKYLERPQAILFDAEDVSLWDRRLAIGSVEHRYNSGEVESG